MPATPVAQRRQGVRVAFAVEDGAQDLQSRHARDVAQHIRQLEVHQLQSLLHPLDVLAAQPHQVGTLADVVAQGVRGVVGLEDAGQQAMAVQPLQPLTIALVGLGPALDLAGELGAGDDDGEARLQQGEEEDVTVDAGGLQGEGGDGTELEPGDELAQTRRVGGELADGRGAVGGGLDADPVGAVADVDAGGVGVLYGQGDELGAGLGLAAELFVVTVLPASGARRRRRGGRDGGHGSLPKNGPGLGFTKRSDGGVGRGPSRPNGIDHDHDGGVADGRHQTSGPKTLPDPVEPTGGARRLTAPET